MIQIMFELLCLAMEYLVHSLSLSFWVARISRCSIGTVSRFYRGFDMLCLHLRLVRAYTELKWYEPAPVRANRAKNFQRCPPTENQIEKTVETGYGTLLSSPGEQSSSSCPSWLLMHTASGKYRFECSFRDGRRSRPVNAILFCF